MNHCVPEFNMDEDHSLPSSSGLPKQKNMQENEIMELLWRNGQVVVQSQNPRLLRKSSNHQPSHPSGAPPPPGSDSTNQLFMQEDEMISWLQYPLEETSFDRDLTDLFYHPPGPPQQPIAHSHHQTPSTSAPPMEVNYAHSSRMNSQFPNSGPSTSSIYIDPREVTGVDSSDTPAMGKKSKLSLPRRHAVEVSGGGNRGTSTAGGEGGCMSVSVSRDGETFELTLTSSPGGSGASASATATADVITLPPEGGRKRKGREPVDDATTDYQSEKDVESYDAKKQTRGVNAKRSRAAEVHNLSERRRRDRINEKMKALQELIPRCNKTDKASMLDEAIEYLKSLQMQVQMMSMGCGMVPVMFPGVQQYMPSMGMGMGMGLGMGMEMGMTRPMMPFPSILSGSGLPTLGATSHMNPRFPHQTFPMPTIPGLDPSRTQPGSNQADATVNPLGMSGHNMARIPNVANPYQQCIGIQHIPMQTPTKNHPNSQPSTSKPSRSREDGDTEKH